MVAADVPPAPARRIKVLHLITRLIVGGAQDNTLVTVARHDRRRYEVHVAGNPAGEWRSRAEEVADAFHPLPDLVNPISPRRDPAALLAILRLLRRERFDVVHTHSSKAGVLGRLAARAAHVPAIVHTMHGPGIHDYMPRWKQRAYLVGELAAARCGDAVIAVCEANRRQAIERFGVAPQRAVTIYSGIDLRRLDGPHDLAAARAALGAPEGAKVVLFVGRLDDAKALHLLLAAFADVVAARPDTVLALVGDGPDELALRTLADDLRIANRVRFLGSRDDVPAFLRLADVFALSSLWEGIGRAMTEAMLMGVPVVVPAISGIPEVVRHDETGLLYPRGDVVALSAGLQRLLATPAEARRLGERARMETRARFEADDMVRSIEGVYDRLLAEAA
jgi:glycosyltransferase involved in cell wall biosynthesis